MKLSITLFLSSLGVASSALNTFVAKLEPISDTDTASGTVFVVTDDDTTSVFYGGHVAGLQPSLDAATCTEKNGCGLHIHSGRGCANATVQEGHFYEGLETDPWLEARYSSNDQGELLQGSWLEIGTNDVDGRAMIVHNEAGGRIGCGILTPVGEDVTALEAVTSPIGDGSTAQSTVVVAGNDDMLCYAGFATGLQSGVQSFLSGGSDCNNTNGCGVHVHSGTACTDKDTQGGHWFAVDTDPWLLESYLTTSETGEAHFGSCIATGSKTSEAVDLPFIVHNPAGGRISCGILTAAGAVEAEQEAPADAPVDVPADAPVDTPTDASSANGAFSYLTLGLVAAFVSSSWTGLA